MVWRAFCFNLARDQARNVYLNRRATLRISLLNITRAGFVDRYNKPKTRTAAVTALSAWDAFLRDRGLGEADLFVALRNDPEKNQRYILLDQLVQHWKRTKSVSSMKTYLYFVKAWLKLNDIALDQFKLKEYVRIPKGVRERRKGIDQNVIRKILACATNPLYKTMIYVLVSSGMRIGEVLEMRASWIDFGSRPVKITIPGIHTKTQTDRITFVTPEAEKWLRDICAGKKPEDRVFPVSYNTALAYIARIRKKCGFTERGANGFSTVRIHAFRGFAENRMSRFNPEFAHAMLGHTKDLNSYYQSGQTDEVAGEDYMKATEFLTIEPAAQKEKAGA